MDPVAVKVEDFNKKFVSGATHNFYTCYKDDHMHVGMLQLKNNSKVRNLYNKGYLYIYFLGGIPILSKDIVLNLL